MGKIFNSILAVTLTLSMAATPLSAQRHRSSGNSRTEHRQNSGSRPTGDRKHPDPNRPGKPDRPNTPAKPTKPAKPAKPVKPDTPDRPGNNRPGNNRPGSGRPGSSAPRPGAGSIPHHGYRPAHLVPPPRPGRPPMRPYNRPVPPPAWRPMPKAPTFAGFLGFTLGTAISTSLDYLFNHGYTVDGYNDEVVYLRNVTEMNLLWPDATLYYNAGGLVGSQFLYSTPYSDRSRFNLVYTRLTSLYGMPTATNNYPGGLSATWFGAGGSYVQLEYKPMLTNGGYTSHFTILQFGN